MSKLYCGDNITEPKSSCMHNENEIGEKLDYDCSPCVATICDQQPHCCEEQWDKFCVLTSSYHTSDVCQPGYSCAHGVYNTGSKLNSECSECVNNICYKMPYCCTTEWDQFCVEESNKLCMTEISNPNLINKA